MVDAPIDEEPRPESASAGDRDDVVLRATLVVIVAIGIVCASATLVMWRGPTMAVVPATAAITIVLALLVIGHVLRR